MDCPDMCGLDVTVSDGRISRIRGVEDHPVTRGYICAKVSRFARRVYHKDRLRFPLRRAGLKGSEQFSRISWHEALAEIADRLDAVRHEWGGEAILPYSYGGSNGFLTNGFIDELFFARLGASRLAKTICAAPTGEVARGMYGKMPGVAFEDYAQAKCILIWGANPKASSIHLIPFIREARRRGAFVVAIDPRRTMSDREVDLHLPVRPGTDLPLALGMIRWWEERDLIDRSFLAQHADGVEPLLERAREWPLDRVETVTGVVASDIETAAARYSVAEPALLRCGWGLERNRNGGHAAAAVLAIPALLGKFGMPGGGYTMSNSGAGQLNRRALLGDVSWTTRELNMTRLGVLLTEPLDPPIKAMFVYNCNPVATVPDQRRVIEGLRRDELFTVVFDQVMTDSAVLADIVLPATTFLEHRDVRLSYGNYGLGGVRPVIDPVGESRSNPEVFAALGRAMGLSDEAFTWDPETYVERVAAQTRIHETVGDANTLNEGRIQNVAFDGRQLPVQFRSVFPRTPDGKVHLTPAELGPMPYVFREDPETRYPLTLLTPASARTICSTFGEFNLEDIVVTLHPDDAAPRGLRSGDAVRVFNDLGQVDCVCRVEGGIRPGVVSIPKGAWRKASRNGWTANALCPSHVSDVGAGACFNDARVDVRAS
jgi:anaerobic selenocysteine-containing dehydrogenase